ncbi:MAG: alpha/beta hydrolase [Candidatus Hydrogenedentes bacterium]|nr:alpha/beta hydrolase [Candidatus Hydrogenedentota bacterium]
MPEQTDEIRNGSDDELIYQVSGEECATPVIYLPGVHGDWTPQAAARTILAEKFRLIEITYPKKPQWRIEDYMNALLSLLDRLEIRSAHVIAESFGSLVGWEFGLEHPARVRSMMIVGGFCQPPGPAKVLFAKWGLSILPTEVFERGVDAYVSIRKHQGKLVRPEMEVDLPYAAVRTDLGLSATIRRFELIGRTDFRHQLHDFRVPVRYIGGELDLIVPVKREIETLDEILAEETGFESRLIPGAPHMIISSHAEETAGQLVEWIEALEEVAAQQDEDGPVDAGAGPS